ncbi:leukotriene C4 synthase isoform X4 [Neopsephotus bourkii]|uniref:leukotriene C4 synthase isoform X4 n=1 Tax=Neopsephotus bourkii TaxID=309878 RepID=UPI002AA597AB|nr:leukotriene C4 synthase isoform X4 [Neopsephotus bourkii]
MWRELSCGGGNTSCCKGTPSPQCCPAERAGEQLDPSHLPGVWVTISNMRHQMDLLATVTVLGVLEQAYFMLQVIHTQQQHRISPPRTTGHPEFEQIFRAQVNCSEYFPVFTSLLWVAGIFFHQAVAAACRLLYLYTHLRYFQGYAAAAQGSLGPLYVSAWVLWLLLGLVVAGLLVPFLLPCCSPWMAVLVQPLQHLSVW